MINNIVLDRGLEVFRDATRLVVLSGSVDLFSEIEAVTLGVKQTPTIVGPQDAVPTGRRVVVSEITDGAVTATGSATHWAIVDDNAQRILVLNAIQAPKNVVLGNAFTLESFSITSLGQVA